MAPVPLPPSVLNNVVNLPQQPHDPPRNRDVINVIRAVKSGRVAFGDTNFVFTVGRHLTDRCLQKRDKLRRQILLIWKCLVIM
jgi:hypothetical protein